MRARVVVAVAVPRVRVVAVLPHLPHLQPAAGALRPLSQAVSPARRCPAMLGAPPARAQPPLPGGALPCLPAL